MRQSTLDSQSLPKSSSSPLKKMAAYLSLMLLGAGAGIGGVYYLGNSESLTRTPQTSALAQNNEQPSNNVDPDIATPTNFVTDVVNRVGPAVVRINASRTVATRTPEMFNDPFFRNFFGSQVPTVPDRQVQRGLGSGFILSADGQIITNAHVVDGADEVSVTLKDGRTYKGRVLGADPVTDVAVVKIDAENLPTVRLGNADNLQVGEWAIAIGNPLGLDNTVTTGIVSGTGRNSSQIGVGDKRINFIQTDAAINPGNSGGPLLNARGEVIGVNTAIIQNAQGLGFAIPINRAQQIAEQLIVTGRVEHAYLGIQMAQITPELKQALKQEEGWTVEGDKGILIVRVMPNSPADRAGLRAGDVIQTVNGQTVTKPDQIQDAVEKTTVGNALPLTIQRNGETSNLDVKVGVLPNQNS
jgi:serine protease Do